MIVQIKGEDKEVLVGCGVTVPIPGTRFRITAEVVEINEDEGRVRIKGKDFDTWASQVYILGVMSPSDFAIYNATNTTGD